jgi:hypothetical protein
VSVFSCSYHSNLSKLIYMNVYILLTCIGTSGAGPRSEPSGSDD